jgi:hypothetical protein
MYNEEELKREILAHYTEYLPGRYSNLTLDYREVPKVNGKQEAFTLNDHEDQTRPAPTGYLWQFMDMYRAYRGDFDKFMKWMTEFFTDALEGTMPFFQDIDKVMIKENVVMTLVNTKRNEHILKYAPTRKLMDLSILYRIIVFDENDEIDTTVISNEIAELMNLNEEQLYEAAVANTQTLLPPVMEPMNEDGDFYVITNRTFANGAAAVLYENLLSDLADMMESDIFLIPSSIHEMIAIPAATCGFDALRSMIRDANENVVPEREVLSDNLYYYSRSEGKLSIAVREKCS